MSKYLVETYYTCSFKVSHYLDDITDSGLFHPIKIKTKKTVRKNFFPER